MHCLHVCIVYILYKYSILATSKVYIQLPNSVLPHFSRVEGGARRVECTAALSAIKKTKVGLVVNDKQTYGQGHTLLHS